jgi:putative NADH-flavin reductase
MKLLILGSTGRTGRLIVAEALKKGHDINVLIRDKNKHSFNHKSITIFEGLPTSINDLSGAMRGCEAVISALNISRTSDFPWAKLRTPKNFLFESMANTIAAAKQQNINRIITISAWGVSETKKELPFWFRWLIDYSNISWGYLEHEAQEGILDISNINWTSVRPTILTNYKKELPVKITYSKSPKPNLFISRRTVAQFIINILQDEKYYRKSLTISQL